MRQVIRLAALLAVVLLMFCDDDKPTPLSPTEGIPHFFFLYQNGHDILESQNSEIPGWYNTLLELNGGGCDTIDGMPYQVEELDSLCPIPALVAENPNDPYKFCFPGTPGVHIVTLYKDYVCLIWNEPLGMQ